MATPRLGIASSGRAQCDDSTAPMAAEPPPGMRACLQGAHAGPPCGLGGRDGALRHRAVHAAADGCGRLGQAQRAILESSVGVIAPPAATLLGIPREILL
jgi:hypothetical protein